MQTIPDSQPRPESTDIVPENAPASQPAEFRAEVRSAEARNHDTETLHAVLASQARDRTKLELWAGMLVGGTNAALIWTRFPSLHWLAAGFAATAFYGAWGLLDRRVMNVDASPDSTRLARTLIRVPRALLGALGWAAALFAIGAFLTAALGGLSIPGR